MFTLCVQVLEAGCLVGVLSQRDLYSVQSLSGGDLDKVDVGEAMSTEVFTVHRRPFGWFAAVASRTITVSTLRGDNDL
jgi:hypothetical protein